MLHKISKVTVLHDYNLIVHFSEGINKQYDVKPLFDKHSMFLPLKDNPELFYEVDVVWVEMKSYGMMIS